MINLRHHITSLLLLLGATLSAQDIEQMLNAKPVEVYGGVSAYTEWYRPEGIDPRGSTFNWGLQGNAGLRLYGWEIPFAFSVGRQRTNFNYPIYNQFGISPTYKWLTVHLGHRNLYFSPFTLGGHTLQGAGIEIKPGKLRLGAMAGTLRRPVQLHRIEDILDVIPAYRRTGYAIKAGLGTDQNYVDLIFFKAKDDSTSIENPFNPEIRPGANTVLGLSIRRQLGKGLHVELESGLSVLTRDQASDDFVEDQEETFWGKIFDLRHSTRVNLAMRAALEYQKGKWRTRFGYDRIDPEYESMGTYFFANDVENFVLGLSGPLSKSISLQTNAGLQRNNLLQTRNARTSRFVSSVNADLHPSPFYGMNISYSNFNISQRASLIPLNDSARLSNISHTFVVAPRYSLIKGERIHSFSATWMYQFLNDRNPVNENIGDFTSRFLSLMYALNLNAAHQVSIGANTNKISIGTITSGQYGATAGYQFNLTEKMLSAGVQGTYNLPSGNQEDRGNNVFLTSNISWQINKLQWTLYYQFLQYSQPPIADYSEHRAGVTLSYSFR